METNKIFRNMDEPTITFNTAELAEKKGFPQRNNDEDMGSGFICGKCWVMDLNGTINIWNNSNAHAAWAAPTQSMLQRWLRETHDLNIVPLKVANTTSNNHKIYLNGNEWYNDGHYIVRGSYEEALEAGLQEALKLIK